MLLDPELATFAGVPAAPVVVAPTLTVAAVPADAVVCKVPSPNMTPLSNFAIPATSNFCDGVVVPMPTLPVEVILNFSVTALFGAPGVLVQNVR
jgi:hypothetical protein